jgi:hypothetical protein
MYLLIIYIAIRQVAQMGLIYRLRTETIIRKQSSIFILRLRRIMPLAMLLIAQSAIEVQLQLK